MEVLIGAPLRRAEVCCGEDDLIEALFEDLRPFQGMEYGTSNRDGNRTQATACLLITQQIVRE